MERGIAFQNAYAVWIAVKALDEPATAQVRVEGHPDVVDIEVQGEERHLLHGYQCKTRTSGRPWSAQELRGLCLRAADALVSAASGRFDVVLTGRVSADGRRAVDALKAAAVGDFEPARALFDPITDDQCAALARVTVVLEEVSGTVLLERAAAAVARMLPEDHAVADAQDRAWSAVLELMQVLIARSVRPGLSDGFVTVEEIAEILGVTAGSDPSYRWPGAIRERYLAAAAAADVSSLVRPDLSSGVMSNMGEASSAAAFTLDDLLSGSDPVLLVGESGSGKSSVLRLLRRAAAERGRIVLVANAEAYTPGRLSALASDALAGVIGHQVPVSTGRAALADPAVILAVDGVAEMPVVRRDALREDLRLMFTGPRNYRVVATGRDLAALRSVAAASIEPAVFQVAVLDRRRKVALASRVLSDTLGQPCSQAVAEAALDRVTAVLGDAMDNPWLLTMAVTLLADNGDLSDVPTVYAEFIGRMLARSGGDGGGRLCLTLGVAFSSLLNLGRRTAHPVEWDDVLTAAAAVTHPLSRPDVSRIDEMARRTGLIVATGYDQMVSPMHDSIADYLSATAIAANKAEWPTHLSQTDVQRLTMHVQLVGKATSTAALVCRDIPFHAPGIARYDRGSITTDADLDALSESTHFLLPDSGPRGVAVWRDVHRTVVFRTDDDTISWVKDADEARLLAATRPWISSRGGPLSATTRIWRQHLQMKLQRSAMYLPPSLEDVDLAAAALAEHSRLVAKSVAALADEIAPRRHMGTLLSALPPPGIHAVVREQLDGPAPPRHRFEVRYDHASDVRVTVASDNGDAALSNGRFASHSDVATLLDRSPLDIAANLILAAINSMAGFRWL